MVWLTFAIPARVFRFLMTCEKSSRMISRSGRAPVQAGFTDEKVRAISVGPRHIPHDVNQKSCDVRNVMQDRITGWALSGFARV